MRHHYSQKITIGPSDSFSYGAVAGCDTAILMPVRVSPGGSAVSIDGTLDGVSWIPIANLQLISMTEGLPVEIPFAGCYQVLRARVTNDADIQWASKWSD